jgi:hypothetical protein
VTVAEHGVKIEALERDSSEQGRDLKGICKDVKAIRQQLDKDEVIEEMQPTSWINKSFKTFLEKGGWILLGWILIKAFLFGEYPVFVQKERPYMKPVIQQMEKSSEAGRQAVVPQPE